MSNARRRSKKKSAGSPLPLALPTEPLKAAPIATMDLYQLRDYLYSEVMHQPYGGERMAQALVLAWGHHKQPATQRRRPCIVKQMLSGPSGCGKTATVECCAHCLGMDVGYEFHGCAIDIDASTCSEQTSVTRITGAGAGYEGCDDENTLPHRLCNALRSPRRRAHEALGTRLSGMGNGAGRYDAQWREYKRMGLALQTEPDPGPPVIFLFIDEIDKADPSLLLAINGLVETGRIDSARGKSFVLPPETALMICFTANYGADTMAQHASLPEDQAVRMIEEDISARGIQKCTLERFGRIVPFFALSDTQLAKVLREKLEGYMARSDRRAVYAEAVKEFLVERLLKMADRERGVRQAVRLMFERLDALFTETMCVMERRFGGMPELDPSVKEDALHVFVHSFNLGDIEAEMDSVLQRIMQSQVNRATLEHYRSARVEQGDEIDLLIQALGIRCGDDILACNVLPTTTALGRTIERLGDQTIQQMARVQQTADAWKGVATTRQETLDEVWQTLPDPDAPPEEMKRHIEREHKLKKRNARATRAVVTIEDEALDAPTGPIIRGLGRGIQDPIVAFAIAGGTGKRKRDVLLDRVMEVVSDDESSDHPVQLEETAAPRPKKKPKVVEEEKQEEPAVVDKEDQQLVLHEDDNTEYRTCKQCQVMKPLTSFGQVAKTLKDGQKQLYRRNVCRACTCEPKHRLM